MSVQRAQVERCTAPLASEWGYRVACERFGQALVDSFPRFSRGPRKGALKGYLCWTKVAVGGWCRNLPNRPGSAGVLRPGTSDWRVQIAHPDADPQGHSVVATWCYNGEEISGRPQPEVKQTLNEAAEMHKAYGTEKRYG